MYKRQDWTCPGRVWVSPLPEDITQYDDCLLYTSHSPESQNYQDELSYMALKCVGIEKCGLCLKACSKQGIEMCIRDRL